MSQHPSTPNASRHPAPSAEKKALLEAFDSVLKTQAEERETSARETEARRRDRASSRPLLAAAAAVLLAIGAYLAIMKPTWVFAPRPTPESLALKEASLRIAMANASQRVQRFRQRNGRLPGSLAETGARGGDLVYSRLGASGYRLMGENGLARVTLTSDDSLPDFLGNSFQIIERRSR
jgi:hypothetical protein